MSFSRRGGFRPNWILQYGARVSCSGRRGRRRVRVSQCYALRVEDVYTELVRQGVDLDPGWCRKVRITLGSRVFKIPLECRANRIWRIGRPFFQCPRCQYRCTRLYMPDVEDVGLECRRCWGLSYQSQQRNYKDRVPRGLLAEGFEITHRMWAYMDADNVRDERRAQSRERQGRASSTVRGAPIAQPTP